ncbi:MAG: hybrid sensor histidine kinase/response regulator [Bacteroidales bacterium]|nr:hybrid sensor histidine kinase/response regulator [Bacteroidales bacterium]
MTKLPILIVDDEVSNQFLLEGLLSVHGYHPILTSCAEECFKVLEERPPELILLDIMMPMMNGLDVLDTIMKHDVWKNIPVIMVSARTSSSDVEEALHKGAIDYIKKPFDEMELIARVRAGIRLKQNEDSLREMVKTRNEFVKIVSHDLRSPFTTIQGFAELLYRADNLLDKQKEMLEYIIKAIEFSDEYFNRLLTWTMLNQGDFRMEKAKHSLLGLIRNVIELFRLQMEEKNQKLTCTIPPETMIMADATFFMQAIANLLSNAIKFTPKGGEIKFFQQTHKGHPILILSDTGTGMPKEIIDAALVDNTILQTRKGTEGEKGSGIGLSISQKILEAHNFSLSFAENGSHGTDVIIRF